MQNVVIEPPVGTLLFVEMVDAGAYRIHDYYVDWLLYWCKTDHNLWSNISVVEEKENKAPKRVRTLSLPSELILPSECQQQFIDGCPVLPLECWFCFDDGIPWCMIFWCCVYAISLSSSCERIQPRLSAFFLNSRSLLKNNSFLIAL